MLTIVIPTIGNRDWQRAVDSVRAQTLPTEWILQPDSGLTLRGAGVTRNKAIAKVKTEWVGFCDDDDYLGLYYHQWLKEESPGYDMIIFKMKNQPVGGIPETCEVDKLEYNKVGISFAMKTKIAQKLKFKDILGEDFDLIMRVKEAGYKIKIVPKIAYFIGDLKE